VHFVGGRHVLHVASVDERHLLRAEADARARAVHRGVAAADHHHAAPFVVRILKAERGGVQIVEAVDHPFGIFARDAEVVRVVAADRHDHRVVALRLQVGGGEVATEHLVALESAAESRDRLVLAVEHLDLRQAVLRDSVTQHTARLRILLEDRDVVAGNQEVEGGGCAGGTGADHGDALPRLRLQFERKRRIDVLVPHRLQHLIAGVAVAVADRDRFVHFVATAVVLARRRADASEDARERDGALEDPRRLAELRLGVRLQEAGDVDVARALVLARWQAVGVVVAEDQLQVGATDLAQPIGLRGDHRRRFRLSRTADLRRVAPLHVDDTHATGAEPRQFRVVAEGRHLDAVRATDLEDRLAFERFELPSVDLHIERRRALRALRAARGEHPLERLAL